MSLGSAELFQQQLVISLDYLSSAAVIFDFDLNIIAANAKFSSHFKLQDKQGKKTRLNEFIWFSEKPEILKPWFRDLVHSNSGMIQLRGKIRDIGLPLSAHDIHLMVQLKTDFPNLCMGQISQIREPDASTRPDVSDEHLFKLLLNELPDAIYFKDLVGRFFLTNRLHAKKLGFGNMEEFIGKTDFDLFSDEHAQQAYNDEQYIINSGQTISKEEKETYHDGSETWVSTSKMPLRNEAGDIVGTFGISKDITQSKNAEIQLRQAEKILSEANAAKDKFFSILAHDLKNPFNSLIGLSEILVEEFATLPEDEKLDMLEKIQRTSESAYNLLEHLLDWSRVQGGGLMLNIDHIKLNPLIDEVLEINQLHSFNKKIEIINEIVEDISLSADENMLRTVLRNLVSNAIKFTMPGGKVWIRAKSEESFVKISVVDNGVGMDQDTQSKLFQISEKVKTYGTNDESGTGLGLIICREFIEKNKGNISVESEEGQGSKFVVSWPV